MRPAAVVLVLVVSVPAVVAPIGPWVPASLPPAAAWAPSSCVTGTDTLSMAVAAWRDYMPKVSHGGGCGCSPRNAPPLRLVVSLRAADGSVDAAPAVDSVWVVHETKALVDGSPGGWSLSVPGAAQLHYGDGALDFAVDDTLEVVLALRGLSDGARWVAARTVVIRTE